MSTRWKVTTLILVLVLSASIFVFALPSILGLLLTILILFAAFDFLQKRRRNAIRTFNSAVRAVCHRKGALSKIVTAFARQGPIRGSCYEYARRLMAGQDPIKAAADSRVPLHLSTAVAMSHSDRDDSERQPSYTETTWHRGESTPLPAYTLIMYVTLTALITCAMLSFVTVFVVPTIQVMLEEFGLSTAPYSWLVVGTTPTWILLTLTAAILLLAVPVLIRNSRFDIPILNWLPVSPQVAETRADMLSGLADAIDAGMPFLNAIDLANQISVDPSERASLHNASVSIQQGGTAADALYQTGWIDGDEFSWLQEAPPARFAQLLRHFGEQGIRDARANFQWLMGILFPTLIILLGLAVASFAYGFLGALLQLITGLS